MVAQMMFFSCWCLPWFCSRLTFTSNIPGGVLFLLGHFGSLLLELLKRKEGSTKQASHMGYACELVQSLVTCAFSQKRDLSWSLWRWFRIFSAMISLQNNFCLHVHSACKTNYFQLFLHYACSYPVWSYFFLAAPVGYSTRTFAARCSAFPDRQPICLEPQVQQLQQELSDERRERQSALHDEKKEREENDLVILTLGITWQLDWLDWFCWSCTVSALGWWTISLAKFRQRVAPRKTVDSKLTTDARLTWCGWKFMTNLFESESCEQKNADRKGLDSFALREFIR